MSDDKPSLGKVRSGDIYNVFHETDEPVLSTTDIANKINWASRSTVLRKLGKMREHDQLQSKKAGEKENAGIVWYPPDDLSEVPPPSPELLVFIYTYPWFSIMIGGLISVGFGFLFFMLSLGEGASLGIIGGNWFLIVSLILLSVGVGAAFIASLVVIWKSAQEILPNR